MKTKENVLAFLEKHRGTAVSGEEMARRLGLSRSAVWKVMEQLRGEGYTILAVPHKGYCLTEENDIFSTQRIGAYMKREDLRFLHYEELDSTNRLAKEKGEAGEAEGLVILADRQTAGRGRKGKSFFSPETGLYMSVLLRPRIKAEDALLITTAAAVAVAEAIESVFDKICEIKWVNDIYIGGKKVCGILTEASIDFESGGLAYGVLGIGVNLSAPKEGFPEDIRHIAAALTESGGCTAEQKCRLTAEICERFFVLYEKLPQKGFMEEYRRRSYLIGKRVCLLGTEPLLEADVLDVDENAHLIVRFDDGEIRALQSGDVSVRGV